MGFTAQSTHRRLPTESTAGIRWGMVEGGIMSDNKPPMTVWLETIDEDGCGMWFDDTTSPELAAAGPYVHLKQFMEELLELLRLVDEVTGWENDLIDTNEFSEDGEAMINDIGNLREYANKLRKEIRG